MVYSKKKAALSFFCVPESWPQKFLSPHDTQAAPLRGNSPCFRTVQEAYHKRPYLFGTSQQQKITDHKASRAGIENQPKDTPFHTPLPLYTFSQSGSTLFLADRMGTQARNSFKVLCTHKYDHLELGQEKEHSSYQGLSKAFNRKHLCQIKRLLLAFCFRCKLSAPKIHPEISVEGELGGMAGSGFAA